MTFIQSSDINEINRNQKIYLHLGCGRVLIPGFINLDIRFNEQTKIDYLSLVYPLDYDNDMFDLAYSSHVLEHFPRKQTPNILKEWVRILKPGGILRLSVPDIEVLMKIYQQTKDLEQIVCPLYGNQDYTYNFHATTFNYNTLKNLMEKAGLEAIHRWDYRRTIHSNFFDFSQAEIKGILISLNIEGRKK